MIQFPDEEELLRACAQAHPAWIAMASYHNQGMFFSDRYIESRVGTISMAKALQHSPRFLK